ncbi:hypothetical protein B0T17DRAFT_219072 [Bombardia bombarda]|uniref:Uncharacterized protein n=1 Tax=Bombardia bombarda TaxID=252184 RepID=A0AA39XAY8_9PEZI|nr:hypothetical protein B0T17DRAFT_219072 [Bombardia bombarda]
MAAASFTDLFGIAFDRDINIVHQTRDQRRDSSATSSSDISLSSIATDEESSTGRCSSASPVNSPPPPEHDLLSPLASFDALVPQGLLRESNFVPTNLSGHDLAALDNRNWVPAPSQLSAIDRFAMFPERHELIALSVALDARCELAYHDYVPCPGSGPGSAAVSVATEFVRPPQVAHLDARADTLVQSRSADPAVAASDLSPPHQRSDMSRQWMALVLDTTLDTRDAQPRTTGPPNAVVGSDAATCALDARQTNPPHSNMSETLDKARFAAALAARIQESSGKSELAGSYCDNDGDDASESSLVRNIREKKQAERRAIEKKRPRSHKRPRLRHPDSPPRSNKRGRYTAGDVRAGRSSEGQDQPSS